MKVILVLFVGLIPVIIITSCSTTANKVKVIPAPQQMVDQLQSKMIDFMKQDAKIRQFKLYDMNLKLLSQQMLNNYTAEAIFEINQMTTQINKPDDVPSPKNYIMKIVGQFKDEQLDPATVKYYIQGLKADQYVPYNTKDFIYPYSQKKTYPRGDTLFQGTGN